MNAMYASSEDRHPRKRNTDIIATVAAPMTDTVVKIADLMTGIIVDAVDR